ncbi:hypothetical protein NPA31_007245 [Aurantimonas sp. MSK8Z-1]|uniref:hypothetical protein n=1 Tax=Mangrovibrevibacter kandeliae TaxID=2968473 RepID=UPI00211739C6|nr:hypothetical protein [Aurantimonas sp. MSK8Z-1]MCW4114757.1 hypothetical protein [Aurantimonas sp. MSK8Z-1]
MLTTQQKSDIERKATGDGSFAIAAAILTLADAVRDAGPPAAVQAIDLSFGLLAKAVTDAGDSVAQGLSRLADVTGEAHD